MAEVTSIERHQRWTRGGGVVSHMNDDMIETLAEQSAMAIGDSGPFGLWALATGSWIFGTVAAGVFALTDVGAVAPILLVFAGVGQVIAGIIAYRRANSLMGTALCSFGALYTTLAVFFGLQLGGGLPAAGAPVVIEGFLLESFAFMALGMAVAAIRTGLMELVAFALLGVGYALIGIPSIANAVGTAGWDIVGIIGGCFLMAAAFVCYYGGLALVVNSAWKSSTLPLLGEP